ncbi:MAG: epoxyqueuosine reductase QueH [Eubacteriales bacterium]|nr:epoxyqueuosine reductase QueH [Eubacteriales bacterium]
MKLLLHICCAPCSVMCVQSLRAEGIEPTGYWYNPNIHPYTEYRARRNALVEYAAQIGMALEVNDLYGLRPFAQVVAGDIGNRCGACYASRMRETARYAAEHGYTYFTSTLFYSVFQKHELIRAAAEDAAAEFGVAFLYRDFRPLFRQGVEEARALGLYMQKYCGCVFSEEERYNAKYRKRLERARKQSGENGEPPTAPPDAEIKAKLRRAGMAFEAALAACGDRPEAPPNP